MIISGETAVGPVESWTTGEEFSAHLLQCRYASYLADTPPDTHPIRQTPPLNTHTDTHTNTHTHTHWTPPPLDGHCSGLLECIFVHSVCLLTGTYHYT